MSRVATLTLSAVVVLIVGVWPIVEYRNVYTFDKRLREVDPGRVYRSGEMTAAGFADAVARYKIRTILNLQDDYPDPDVTAASGTGTPSRKANSAGNWACATSSSSRTSFSAAACRWNAPPPLTPFST